MQVKEDVEFVPDHTRVVLVEDLAEHEDVEDKCVDISSFSRLDVNSAILRQRPAWIYVLRLDNQGQALIGQPETHHIQVVRLLRESIADEPVHLAAEHILAVV